MSIDDRKNQQRIVLKNFFHANLALYNVQYVDFQSSIINHQSTMDNLENPKGHILINNIIDVFSDIDLEIAKLQKCSEDDFKTFYDVMLKSHKNAKQISNYADEIIELSSTNDNKKLINTLKSEYSSLSDSCNKLKGKLNKQTDLFSDFLDKIRYLNLPLKNLKQNFFTLKYILANLKLETYHVKNETNYIKDINTVEQNILKNTSVIKKMELNFASLQTVLEEQISIKTTQILQNLDGTSNSFDRLQNAADLLNKEYTESEKYYSKIKQKIAEASESINKIVIKLQYQDIIRQKMEHIQINYKKIIDYFDNLKKNKKYENNEILQYYSKIEYIASLQVAQLIQTNKEYEQAIESISEQLLQITLTINDISYFLKVFTNELPKQEDVFLQWTKKYLLQIKTEKENLELNKLPFIENVNSLKTFIPNFKLLFNEIENISQTTTLINNLNIVEYANLSKTINFKKLIEVASNIDNLIASIKKKFKEIKPEIWNFYDIDNILSSLNTKTLENIEFNIGEIKSNEEILEEILKKSINLAKKISTGVINSIKDVSYYDSFEKSIEKIISKLDLLNEKLKYKKTKISKEDIIDLQEFESIYTVKTESEIHELLINDGDLNATEKLENIENNEDSDVEFF